MHTSKFRPTSSSSPNILFFKPAKPSFKLKIWYRPTKVKYTIQLSLCQATTGYNTVVKQCKKVHIVLERQSDPQFTDGAINEKREMTIS